MSDAPNTIWAHEPTTFDGMDVWTTYEVDRSTHYTLTASVAARLKAADELHDMVELFCNNKATTHQLVRSYFAYRATKEIPE